MLARVGANLEMPAVLMHLKNQVCLLSVRLQLVIIQLHDCMILCQSWASG